MLTGNDIFAQKWVEFVFYSSTFLSRQPPTLDAAKSVFSRIKSPQGQSAFLFILLHWVQGRFDAFSHRSLWRCMQGGSQLVCMGMFEDTPLILSTQCVGIVNGQRMSIVNWTANHKPCSSGCCWGTFQFQNVSFANWSPNFSHFFFSSFDKIDEPQKNTFTFPSLFLAMFAKNCKEEWHVKIGLLCAETPKYSQNTGYIWQKKFSILERPALKLTSSQSGRPACVLVLSPVRRSLFSLA